jgi:hypothetical protein
MMLQLRPLVSPPTQAAGKSGAAFLAPVFPSEAKAECGGTWLKGVCAWGKKTCQTVLTKLPRTPVQSLLM